MKMIIRILQFLMKPSVLWITRLVYFHKLVRWGFWAVTRAADFSDGVKVGRKKIAGGITAAWLTPTHSKSQNILLYLHGGGYVIGSIDTHIAMVSQFAELAGIEACIIDYRLAPEHPYPAALDDAFAAYEWLLKEFPNRKIVLSGESAGGGLTIALLLKIKEKRLPQPHRVAVLSPWADLSLSGNSMKERIDRDPIVKPQILALWGRWYSKGGDRKNPFLSPIFGDLSGLPPLYIQVGTEETLYDDSVRLHERALAAGVDSTLYVADGMVHVWQMNHGYFEQATEDVQKIADFLGK